jgi:hypothetical protein
MRTGIASIDWFAEGLPTGRLSNFTFGNASRTTPVSELYGAAHVLERLPDPRISVDPAPRDAFLAAATTHHQIVVFHVVKPATYSATLYSKLQTWSERNRVAVLFLTHADRTPKGMKFYTHFRLHFARDEGGFLIKCVKNVISITQGHVVRVGLDLEPLIPLGLPPVDGRAPDVDLTPV